MATAKDIACPTTVSYKLFYQAKIVLYDTLRLLDPFAAVYLYWLGPAYPAG
jgi:hypothetical protein